MPSVEPAAGEPRPPGDNDEQTPSGRTSGAWMTSMPLAYLTLPHPYLRSDDLCQLVAGVPGPVGYPPTDSLVLITFTMVDRLRLGATFRSDLPAPARFQRVIDSVSGLLGADRRGGSGGGRDQRRYQHVNDCHPRTWSTTCKTSWTSGRSC